MGEHGFDAVSGLRAARIALPCAAASLPTSLLIGSTVLEVVAVLSFVLGAFALYVARGERVTDGIGGLAAAAALVCVPGVPAELMPAMVCTFSISSLIAFFVAGHHQRKLGESTNTAERPQQEAANGIASV
jgi:hypothetical protein